MLSFVERRHEWRCWRVRSGACSSAKKNAPISLHKYNNTGNIVQTKMRCMFLTVVLALVRTQTSLDSCLSVGSLIA